ncbi:hypothetical protein BH11BAC3_BH11BAC3_14490 [soil metagenome]
MKHLFFVAVAVGIFSGTTISVKAQTNVGIERYAGKNQKKVSPKFIDDIELSPESTTVYLGKADEKDNAVKSITHIPNSVEKSASGNIEGLSSLQFKYALLTDRDVEELNNSQLYSFIDSWWGTRYRYGGSTRDGIDCSAFTVTLLSDVYGLESPRTAEDQYNSCEKISLENLKEGDLVFFNTRRKGRSVSHVGLYLGNSYFVHSSVHDGVTISSLSDGYYSQKFISGGRLAK